MATTTSDTQQQPREGGSNGLFASLLSGFLGEPVRGSQLVQALHGPTRFEPGDNVDQEFLGIDAEDEAVVDEGISDGESFAPTHGAREEETAASNSEGSNSAFGTAVVNLESAVSEAASKECALIDSVGRRSLQRRFRQQLRMNGVDPIVKYIEYRERALLSFSKSIVGIKLPIFPVFLNEIEVGEVFYRNRGPPVLG